MKIELKEANCGPKLPLTKAKTEIFFLKKKRNKVIFFNKQFFLQWAKNVYTMKWSAARAVHYNIALFKKSYIKMFNKNFKCRRLTKKPWERINKL